MGQFQLKEGLFEYSEKRLAAEEYEDALRRIRSRVMLDESLKHFMQIDCPSENDAAEAAESASGAT